jgi:heterodisulfide reductase subunit C
MENEATMVEPSQNDFKLATLLTEEILNIPNGEKFRECIQCGTCSSSCPTAYAMDHSPRELIAALRAGQVEKVLTSNTPWFCTSCYYCTVRCPSLIPITEMMYTLKNTAISTGYIAEDAGSKVLYTTFVDNVNKTGRLHEMGLMVRVILKTKMRKLLSWAPLGIKLYFKRRMSLFSEKIKNIDQVQAILKVCEEEK